MPGTDAKGAIVRNVDLAGRIVIPAEIRHRLGWVNGREVEIWVEGQCIVARSVDRGCRLCGGVDDDYLWLRNAKICRDCVEQVRRL